MVEEMKAAADAVHNITPEQEAKAHEANMARLEAEFAEAFDPVMVEQVYRSVLAEKGALAAKRRFFPEDCFNTAHDKLMTLAGSEKPPNKHGE